MANSDGYNQQVGETSTDACSAAHTEARDGDSAGNTRAFRGAEAASRRPAQENDYGEIAEEKGSVPVRQHFVLPNARSLLPCSPSLL